MKAAAYSLSRNDKLCDSVCDTLLHYRLIRRRTCETIAMAFSDLPPYKISICQSSKREPGMMVFNVRHSGVVPGGANGWILAVDQGGELVFSLRLPSPTQDVRLHPNGNLFYSQTGVGVITEIDLTGTQLRQWHIVGKWIGKTPPVDSIPIDIPLMTHTLNVFPNGNLLLNSAEGRHLKNWHGSDIDPKASREDSYVIGDVFYEIDLNGNVLRDWHSFDFLDTERICYGSLRPYWERHGFPNSRDWCHANSSCYVENDNSLLLSFRTQDCIVKLDYETGELRWILGTHDNWGKNWLSKLLQPDETVTWQYHQHDVSYTSLGSVLCFDNGNYRATPYKRKLPPEENYSRVVEFVVDEERRTVKQVWSYGEPPQEKIFACYQGGAYLLPATANKFITYGGICTNDGVPVDDNANASFGKCRLVEVTPEKEIVFEMWIDSSNEPNPFALSTFRAEHVPIP